MPEFIEFSPPWSRQLNFTVYRVGQRIRYIALIEKLQRYAGNIQNKQDGWLADYPYFRLEDNDEDLADFIYISFKKDGNVSNLYGEHRKRSDPIGCVFDFNNNLIIVSTTNHNKIANLLVKKAFVPIQDLTSFQICDYSGDFVFWLSYLFMETDGQITNDIKVSDFLALRSGREEELGISDAISSNTEVTSHLESKVILALSGAIQNASLKIISDQTYNFILHSDGRIKARETGQLNTSEEKAIYARQIHNIIQDMYSKYLEAKPEWDKIKPDYQRDMLRDVQTNLSDLLKES